MTIRHGLSEPVRPSRVVVLGGSGFVGRAILEELGRLNVPAVSVSSQEVDLCRPEAVEQLRRLVRQEDALVFVSALTPDKGKDAGTLMRNLAMGQQVSALVEQPACSHVVYVSSDAVYSDAVCLIRETSPCDPATFHGLMHLVRERMITLALQPSRTPLLILRPSLLYGPGDTHNGYGPNRFLRSAREERRIVLIGQGEEKRDHVFIRDLSRLIGLCLFHRSAGTLDVATGISTSFAEVAQGVAALFEERVAIESRPRVQPVTHRHFDIAALIKAFPPFRFASLQEGLMHSLSAEVMMHG